MVNWKDENTLATPSIEINRVQILERRAYVIESLEEYYSYVAVGSTARKNKFVSRLISLFFEIAGLLKRTYNREDLEDGKLTYTKIENILFNNETKSSFEDYKIVWDQLNQLLDEINLTKIDTKKAYDQTNPEDENKVHSL